MKMKTLKKSWNFWESLRERVSSLQTSSSDALIAECKKNLAKATLAGTVTKIGSSNGMPVYIWNKARGRHEYQSASLWELAPNQQKVWEVWNVPFERYYTLITDDGIIFRTCNYDLSQFASCFGSLEEQFAVTDVAPAHLWQDSKYGIQYLCRPLSAAELDAAYCAKELTDEQKCQILRKIFNACVESVKRQDVELLCSPYCLKQYRVKKIVFGNKAIYQPDDSGEVTVCKIALIAEKVYFEDDSNPYFISVDIDSEGNIFKINGCTESENSRLKNKNETGCPGVCKYGKLLGNPNVKTCKFAKDGDCLCWFPLSEQEIEATICKFDIELCTGLFKLPDTQKTIELYFYK